ncbi:hypothetical protein ACHQM5_009321 [Ranunculus cassubicifolius]
MAIIKPNTPEESVPQTAQEVELTYAQAPGPPPPAYDQPQPPQKQQPLILPAHALDHQVPQFGVPVQTGVTVPRPWTSGLCGCFEDVPNCIVTAVCPCVTFGQIAEMTDSGMTNCALAGCLYFMILYCFGCPCWYSCCYRPKLRMLYSLPEEPCPDCLVHCFCEWCALCQEFRELKNRGANPNAGWQAYAQKVREGGIPTMAPVVAPTMKR